jgi:hypothetical protein
MIAHYYFDAIMTIQGKLTFCFIGLCGDDIPTGTEKIDEASAGMGPLTNLCLEKKPVPWETADDLQLGCATDTRPAQTIGVTL